MSNPRPIRSESFILKSQKYRFDNLSKDEYIKFVGNRDRGKHSPRKRLANQLRNLRTKGITDSDSRHLWELMTDPRISALDQYLYIKRIKDFVGDDPRGMAVCAKLMNDWHKTYFGDGPYDWEDKVIKNVDRVLSDGEKEKIIKELISQSDESNSQTTSPTNGSS